MSAPQPTARPARNSPTLNDVRQFWNANPLYSGESCRKPGERAFYEDHEAMTLHEHSGRPDPIFFRSVSPGCRLLDVGCGIGFWVHQFCRLGANVSACDLSETAVELTRRRAEMFQLAAEIQQGNAEQLPYPDETFDHVNCQGVIHHTPDTARCIREFHRVLKPGGTLCFSVYYRTLVLRWRWLFRVVSWLTRSWLRLPGRGRESMMTAADPDELIRLYDGAGNPIGKAFTKQELDRMLAGLFVVKETRRVGFPRRVLPVSMPDGLHRLLARLAGLMIVLHCGKPAIPSVRS